MIEPASINAESHALEVRAPVAIIDIPRPGPRVWLVILGIFLVSVAAGVVTPICLAAGKRIGLAVVATALVVLALFFVGIVIFMRFWGKSRRRRLEAILDTHAGNAVMAIRTAVSAMHGMRLSDLFGAMLAYDLFAAMLSRDLQAMVVRVGPRELLHPVRAFTMPFEPQILDENDQRFEDIRVGAVSGPDTGERPQAEQITDVRRFKRYFFGRYAWIGTLFLGFMVLINAIVSWRRGYPTWPLGLWAGLLLLRVFAFRRQKIHSAVQLFAVPGGLIVRKFGRVRLYSTAASIVLARVVTHHTWQVLIGDKGGHDGSILTTTELDFLLSAWHSPLPSPSADQVNGLSA